MPDSVDLERFRRAAAAGHPQAQFNLGLWHLRQAPRGSVPTETQELLLAAAKQNFVPAQTLLGKLLYKLAGAEQRPMHARYWFERAAEAGDAEAQYRLGELLALGLTEPPDASLAFDWLERAAAQGHVTARMQMAYCLEYGLGREADVQAATRLCFEAAGKGDPRAQNCLGRRYASGHTLPQNASKALAWHLRAAAGHYPGATAEVARLSASLDETAVREGQLLAEKGIPEDAPAPAAPRVPSFDAQILSRQPFVTECRDFLTPDECDHLIAVATPFLAPSKVLSNTGEHEQWDARTSQEMAMLNQIKDLVVANIEQRLADLAALPVQHGEPLVILHYGPGDEYRPHHDYFDPRIKGNAYELGRAGQRVITVLTYLCEVEDGGATCFPKIDLRVKAEKGKALLFRNCRDDGSIEPSTLHAGEPVQAGEKWLATRWIRERMA
ncbi:MAG: 2OG-Fe(II) oxygenase [Gammaproteobacteria bacterium]